MAALKGRSLGSLVLRMRNFQFLDNVGKAGMAHVAKTDKLIYEEFRNDWGELSYLAERITGLALFDSTPDKGAKPISSLTNRKKVNRERHFFRSSVFAAYNSRCCISGLAIPSLLAASHIKPYRTCRTSNDRTDPHNGLLLNSIYDKAFDQGLITVTPDLTIRTSQIIKSHSDNEWTRLWLSDLDGRKIIASATFPPNRDSLEYHNDVIFKG